MGIGFGAFFSAILQSYSFNYMGQKLGRRIRIMMMGALMRQEIGWYDEEKNSSGVLATKLSSDSLAVKGQFGDTMGLLTQVCRVVYMLFRQYHTTSKPVLQIS